MLYSETLRNAKSRRILERGTSVYLGCYDYPNGAKWLARYNNKFYLIIHDGTGNQFFHSHAPEEISENEAKRILIETFEGNELEEALEELDIKISDDEMDKLLGL